MSTPSTFAGFTQSHRRIFAVLRDGKPHPYAQLFACLGDELSGDTAVKKHVCDMRKTLRAAGYDVVGRCEQGQTYYQLVRLIVD